MGKQILVIGAGKSASVLIEFLQKKLVEKNWYMVLADADPILAAKKWNNAPNGHSIGLDIQHTDQRRALIQNAEYPNQHYVHWVNYSIFLQPNWDQHQQAPYTNFFEPIFFVKIRSKQRPIYQLQSLEFACPFCYM